MWEAWSGSTCARVEPWNTLAPTLKLILSTMSRELKTSSYRSGTWDLEQLRKLLVLNFVTTMWQRQNSDTKVFEAGRNSGSVVAQPELTVCLLHLLGEITKIHSCSHLFPSWKFINRGCSVRKTGPQYLTLHPLSPSGGGEGTCPRQWAPQDLRISSNYL